MNYIDIVPASSEHYDDILKIFNECFFPKFFFVDKREDRIKDIIHDFGLIDLSTRNIAHVAIVDGKVSGILILDWIEHSLKDHPTNLSFYNLFRKYGLLRLFRMIKLGKIFKYKPDEDEIYIDSIGVSSDARGMGIGTKLINHAFDYAKKGAYEKVTLKVIKENHKAKKLYEREGFQEISYQDIPELKSLGFSGAYLMEKILR